MSHMMRSYLLLLLILAWQWFQRAVAKKITIGAVRSEGRAIGKSLEHVFATYFAAEVLEVAIG
jgi:hypothetical protein